MTPSRSSDTPQRGVGASTVGRKALFVALLLLVFAGLNVWVARFRFQGQPLPAYGTWTGIVTLENKIQLLREFAREGPVDALILSSSIGDFGVSAEVLTNELSAARGESFRVFNFSVGGSGPTTYSLLYRLARLVSNPKEVWLVCPVEQNGGDVLSENGPDYTLLRAPVGAALRHPLLLPLSFVFFDLPLVRTASALRDLAIHGEFVNRPITHADIYAISAYGDTHSFSYFSNPQAFEYDRELRRTSVLDLAGQYAKAALDGEDRRRVYLSDSQSKQFGEMRELADQDNVKLTIIAHDRAGGLFMRDAAYMESSKRFYELVGQRFDVPVVDVRSSFTPRHYKVSDSQHLNALGAAEFSALLAAALANRPVPESIDYHASEPVRAGLPDPKGTNHTAIVTKRLADSSSVLQLRYMQNWGLLRLRPYAPVRLALRLPDNEEVVVPARVMTDGSVLADMSRLPPSSVDHLLLVQLVPRTGKWGSGINLPLASFQWLPEKRPPEFFTETLVKLNVGATSYTPLDPIQASWSDIDDPKPRDWIGLFPEGADDQSRIAFTWTNGTASGNLAIPPTLSLVPGEYELRLYANDAWEMLAVSRPFLITKLSGSVEVRSERVPAGGSVTAYWSEISQPTKEDWLGLFPKEGDDGSRLAFEFTGGQPEGSLKFTLDHGLPAGDYEIRLYSSGGWTRLGTTAPFQIVQPDALLNVEPGGGLPRIR